MAAFALFYEIEGKNKKLLEERESQI